VAAAATTVAIPAANINALRKPSFWAAFLLFILLTQKLKSCIISVRGD
jgi:hypothetical protein